MVMLAFCRLITGAGVAAGSADAGTLLKDREKQHPLGTVIIAVLVTFP